MVNYPNRRADHAVASVCRSAVPAGREIRKARPRSRCEPRGGLAYTAGPQSDKDEFFDVAARGRETDSRPATRLYFGRAARARRRVCAWLRDRGRGGRRDAGLGAPLRSGRIRRGARTRRAAGLGAPGVLCRHECRGGRHRRPLPAGARGRISPGPTPSCSTAGCWAGRGSAGRRIAPKTKCRPGWYLASSCAPPTWPISRRCRPHPAFRC